MEKITPKTNPVSKQTYIENLFQSILVKSIIANQNAIAHNEMLKNSPYYKKTIKEYGNKFLTALINYEDKEFSKLFLSNSKETVILINKTRKAIDLLAKCVLTKYDDIIIVLEALIMDRDSIVGIAKKIIKNKKMNK